MIGISGCAAAGPARSVSPVSVASDRGAGLVNVPTAPVTELPVAVGMHKTDVQRILGDPPAGQWDDDFWSYRLKQGEFSEAEYDIYFEHDQVTKIEKRLKDSRVHVEGLW